MYTCVSTYYCTPAPIKSAETPYAYRHAHVYAHTNTHTHMSTRMSVNMSGRGVCVGGTQCMAENSGVNLLMKKKTPYIQQKLAHQHSTTSNYKYIYMYLQKKT